MIKLFFEPGDRIQRQQSLRLPRVAKRFVGGMRGRSLVLWVMLFSASITTIPAIAQTATWIWYPGDYEIALSNQMQNRRTERGAFLPVFWKMDSYYTLVEFTKTITLQQPEQVSIAVEGDFHVRIDGKALEGMPAQITIPAGKHTIAFKIFNQAHVPALFVKGKSIVSDTSWLSTFENKEWIDQTGVSSDVSSTTWVNAGCWNFNESDQLPSAFKLPVTPLTAVSVTKVNDGLITDFGKETFGFLKLHGVKGKGTISIYYGESKEEAMSSDQCELLDRISINANSETDTTLIVSRAYRYVHLQYDNNITVSNVSMLHEYAALPDKGGFTCSDENINKIYETAKYTLHLCTREFFIDGIKRDRWVWSGDAYQSYLMNYYLMNDNETVKRSIYALRGKDPVTSHINTIMDYTLYWFMSIYDYYQYSGDTAFLRQNYPRMKSMMDFCLGRRNQNGLLEGMPGDWIFIDWARGMSKQGELSFEQLLFCRSLETMTLCAGIAGDKKDQTNYKQLAEQLRQQLFTLYWNNSKQALVHSRINGKQTDNVTRYANMFAIFFDYFSPTQKEAVKKSVLLNDSIQKITTPYMQFYELESLCAMGEQEYVLKRIKDYWGSMLQLGATSFWEEYDPAKKGAEHYAMYGRPFGKSLCHAWGASPLYLLGKYYLGIKPTAPGYSNYVIEPNLGGLQWMQGKVPTPQGEVELYVNNKQIKVKGATGTGVLKFKSKSKPVCKEGVIKDAGTGQYELNIEKDKSYTVNYKLN